LNIFKYAGNIYKKWWVGFKPKASEMMFACSYFLNNKHKDSSKKQRTPTHL